MIKHISYYKDGKRHIVKPNSKGKFSIAVGSGEYGKINWAELTAKELVEHPLVRDCDPTITLEDGNKLRVYYAGNPTIPIVHPSLVLDRFDKQSREKRKTSLEKRLETLKKQKDKKEQEKKQPITQPMAPIAPPYPGKKVKVSSSPPQKQSTSDDPFGPILDAWFGVDEADDTNNDLYDDDYQYGYDDGDDW